jgi:hypothetical protein
MTFPRIFVGGTGRSGTWLLYQTLGSHKSVHTFPAELRFMIDPGGLIGLVDDLSIRYSPARAREALFQFERLMRVYLATPGKAPYAAIDLPAWLGGDFYWRRLDRFCQQLVEIAFDGFYWDIEVKENEGRVVKWAKKYQETRQKMQGKDPGSALEFERDVIKEAKYFSDRKQLVALAAEFVDDLFVHAAQASGKETWCEKTPQHLLHLDFLWELFPESVFIHIKRDPRGVVQSFAKQRWGPNDIQQAACSMKNMYQRWLNLKPTLDLERRKFLEIKLEDLVTYPQELLEEVTTLCGLENQNNNLPEFSLEKANYWQKTLTAEDIDKINQILGAEIEQMGYEV